MRMRAFEWAADAYDRPILLCGDSRRRQSRRRGQPRDARACVKPVGQVLIYPGLGGDMKPGSYVTHAEAPMLTVRDLDFYKDIRTGGVDRTGDITMSPLADANFANLPPTVIVTAECDPLSSDGEAYRSRIVAAGGRRGVVRGDGPRARLSARRGTAWRGRARALPASSKR